MRQHKSVKIVFTAPQTGDPFEVLDAVCVAPGQYQITGIPIFVATLANSDMVNAVDTGECLESSIDKVVKRGGHSTFWATFDKHYLDRLVASQGALTELGCQFITLGCEVEVLDDHLAIDAPVEVDIMKLILLLNTLKKQKRITHWRVSHWYSPPKEQQH